MLSSLYYSFTSYHITGTPQWLGLGNFQEMFTQDNLFWLSLWNSTVYSLVSVPLDVAIALILAVMLNMAIPGRTIFRTIFFLPYVIGLSTLSFLLVLEAQPGSGGVNLILKALHNQRQRAEDDISRAAESVRRIYQAEIRNSETWWGGTEKNSDGTPVKEIVKRGD